MELLKNFLAYNQCPWDRHLQANIHFCEAQLCQWVVKPAETWSNIGFFLVGVWVLWLARKQDQASLRLIGVIGMILGVFSAAFHATGTYWGQYLDVGSMILFVVLGLTFNLQRLLGWSKSKQRLAYWAICSAILIGMIFIHKLGIPMFGLLFIVAALIEWRLWSRSPIEKRADYRYFKAMAASFLFAWLIWTLDMTKVVCDPDNHWFNGHAFWHLVCALNFYFVYRFYADNRLVPADL